MKELSIEQKAKAYDKALDRAKKVHKYSSDIAEIKRMEHIFPELREDEEIREELINYLKYRYNSTTLSGEERECKKWISWLENQGEQKEWSEEDKSMYIRTLGVLGKCYMGQLPDKVEEELNWFKTLEERIRG